MVFRNKYNKTYTLSFVIVFEVEVKVQRRIVLQKSQFIIILDFSSRLASNSTNLQLKNTKWLILWHKKFKKTI